MESAPAGPVRAGLLEVWWLALRPFSFPASTMPVLFGTVLAVTVGGAVFRPLLFIAALVAMLLLHGGANVLNDVCDFRKGLDREVLPVSGAVVRGLLSPGEALRGALVLFGAGSLLGLFLAWMSGWSILLIGLIGVAVGVLYSATPLGLKYRALGDLAVFLNFGLLGSLGAWTIQAGRPAWLPVFWALPFSLLVVGILHANNWRDIRGDKAGGCATVASLLGERRSEAYYRVLILAPFILVGALMALPLGRGLPAMPLTFLLVLLALPQALGLLGRARSQSSEEGGIAALDGATARLNLLFGLLCTVALVVHALLEKGR
jgi:1,4-dihydroxy-2-naphthoate polyprenyltransferase